MANQDNELRNDIHDILEYAKKYPRQLFWFLTKDDFAIAKVLWGENFSGKNSNEWYNNKLWTDTSCCIGSMAIYRGERWQYHLQNIVISENPIKYLEEQQNERLQLQS